MSKFYGKIGFSKTVEDPPDSGNWLPAIIEKKYYGDILQRNVHIQEGDTGTDQLTLNNDISIVADNFLLQNAYAMRYVEYLGIKWEIRTITVNFPRINFTFGGAYNGTSGPEAETDTTEPSEGDSESS